MRVYDWTRLYHPVPTSTLVNLHIGERTMFGRAGSFSVAEWALADWYSVVRHGDD